MMNFENRLGQANILNFFNGSTPQCAHCGSVAKSECKTIDSANKYTCGYHVCDKMMCVLTHHYKFHTNNFDKIYELETQLGVPHFKLVISKLRFKEEIINRRYNKGLHLSLLVDNGETCKIYYTLRDYISLTDCLKYIIDRYQILSHTDIYISPEPIDADAEYHDKGLMNSIVLLMEGIKDEYK